jgi:hypothetical protein
MKYIDVEKLKVHIEAKMVTLWDKLPDADKEHPTDIELRDLGMYMALEGLIEDLDSLQQEQPSLPDNLDESAREIVIKMHPCLKDCTILGDRLTRGQLMALVKAGAEWMAKQINNDN